MSFTKKHVVTIAAIGTAIVSFGLSPAYGAGFAFLMFAALTA